jgi:hypothetical protein
MVFQSLVSDTNILDALGLPSLKSVPHMSSNIWCQTPMTRLQHLEYSEYASLSAPDADIDKHQRGSNPMKNCNIKSAAALGIALCLNFSLASCD